MPRREKRKREETIKNINTIKRNKKNKPNITILFFLKELNKNNILPQIKEPPVKRGRST